MRLFDALASKTINTVQVNHVKPQTTIKAVRDSGKAGSTIYQTSTNEPVAANVELSEALLDTASPKKSVAVANTRVLRPRKPRLKAENQGAAACGSGCTHLPTPVPSDGLALHEPTPVHMQKPRRGNSDSDFEIFDEEADSELLALTKQAESSTAAERSRGWKQNMRDVHEEEDYGGALFDDEERLLLGEFGRT